MFCLRVLVLNIREQLDSTRLHQTFLFNVSDQAFNLLSARVSIFLCLFSIGDLPQHLQVMINILRSEDRIKLVRDAHI